MKYLQWETLSCKIEYCLPTKIDKKTASYVVKSIDKYNPFTEQVRRNGINTHFFTVKKTPKGWVAEDGTGP